MSHKPPFYKRYFHNARRFIAKYWLNDINHPLQIAITGSQGKTNTSRIIGKLLESFGSTICTDLNLDTIYNVPITALKVTPFTRYVFFELGVDHAGEMDFHLQIVKPKISLVTGISPVHTDPEHFGSLDKLVEEKQKLIEALPKDGIAVLNWDDENIRKMGNHTKAKILWYGSDKEHCDVWFDKNSVEVSQKGTKFEFFDKESNKSFYIESYLLGKHHSYNILAALLTIEAIQKITRTDISMLRSIEIIKNLKPLVHRMSLEKGPIGTLILDDSIRANPSSTASGLETFSLMKYQKARKIAVLAEMGELQFPQKEHEKIGRLVARLHLDFLISIGPMQKYTAQAAVENGMDREKVYYAQNIIEAANHLKQIVRKNDFIYLKGSLLRHLERLPMILENIEVGCRVVSCPFYWSCKDCSYLKIGYQNL